MGEISHRILEVNGIKMHIAEQGTGPTVLLLHGFPSLWYTWRHQIPVLAKAGYHVVAPDLRGYGQTEAPSDPSKYTFLHIAGDVVGLIEALGEKQVYIVAHDWGSATAWFLALFRPDLVKCIVALCVPFLNRHPTYSMVDIMRAKAGDKIYVIQFQEPGKAEADLSKDIKLTFEKLYSYRVPQTLMATDEKSIIENIETPKELPSWITPEEIQYYVDSFTTTGFTPALNWYRNLHCSWELTAAWSGKSTPVPGLVVIGDIDLSIEFTRPYLESQAYKNDVPNGEYIILPNLAHFLHEESPQLVNNHILEYVKNH